MADVVLGFATSHGPQLRMPPETWHKMLDKDMRDPRMSYEDLLARDGLPDLSAELTEERFKERYDACHAALGQLRQTVADAKPDAIVILGDDQHEQFWEGNMPMFSVYYGDTLPVVKREQMRDPLLAAAWKGSNWRAAQDESGVDGPTPAHPELAMHLINTFRQQGVDVATSNELKGEVGAGHAFAFLYRYILPSADIPVVPFSINCFFKPNQPTPSRCYDVGRVLREALASWGGDKRIAVMASGGLSHFVIDEELDRGTLDALQTKDVETLKTLPEEKLNLGNSEIRNWVALGGVVEDLDMTVLDYQPCYRSPAGTGCAMGFASWQ